MYNMFRQIHLDQSNSCFYLQGNYETPIYYFKKSANSSVISQELISVEKLQNRMGKMGKNSMRMQNRKKDKLPEAMQILKNKQVNFNMLTHFEGNLWDFNFVRERVETYLPLPKCKTVQQSFIFYGIATAVAHKHLNPTKVKNNSFSNCVEQIYFR